MLTVLRHHAANRPSKRERQVDDRPGHIGLGDSLIWDSDDMPSLQHPLSRAPQLYFREEGLTWEPTAAAALSVRETWEVKSTEKTTRLFVLLKAVT